MNLFGHWLVYRIDHGVPKYMTPTREWVYQSYMAERFEGLSQDILDSFEGYYDFPISLEWSGEVDRSISATPVPPRGSDISQYR